MSAASCDSIRAALPWFVGEELEPEHLASVRAHLVDCFACRAEASALQQGVSRLQRAAAAPVAGVDDAFFGELHRTVVSRVEAMDHAEHRVAAGSPGGGIRAGLALAAMALVGLGFWLGRGTESSIFDRRPLATPVSIESATGTSPALVVPWSGPRWPAMRPLGNEADSDLGGERAGMMARDRLRDLVDERMVLPPRQAPPR